MAWIQAHEAVTIGTVFAVVNGAIKVILWLHPIPDWVAIFERNPRVAAFVRLLAALGINPVSALQALADLLLARTSVSTRAAIHSMTVSAASIAAGPGISMPADRYCVGCRVSMAPLSKVCPMCGCGCEKRA
jgi:hypothetical protein